MHFSSSAPLLKIKIRRGFLWITDVARNLWPSGWSHQVERVTSCAECFHSVHSCMNGAGSVSYLASRVGIRIWNAGSQSGGKRVGVDADGWHQDFSSVMRYHPDSHRTKDQEFATLPPRGIKTPSLEKLNMASSCSKLPIPFDCP